MRSSQHLLDARHRSLAPASRNPSGVDTQFGVAVDGGYFVYDRRSAIVVSLLAAIIIRLDDHVHAESYATTRTGIGSRCASWRLSTRRSKRSIRLQRSR